MKADTRFWSKVDRSGGRDSCWLWLGTRFAPRGRSVGYGLLKRNKVAWLAHRFAWTLKYGPIPDGKCVLHRCDNPPCVNPNHLFLGTQLKNIADRVAKGRSYSARLKPEEKAAYVQSTAKRHLTVEEKASIKARHVAGESKNKLAIAFKVSWTKINWVISN